MVTSACAFASAQVSWPPASCGCAEWHQEHVESYAPCAENSIVRVTRFGGNGSISFMQFLNQLNKDDSTTYVIAADTAPYILGCRNITIGGSTEPRRCIMVRGETGRREDVVLAGLDPRTSPNFWKSSEYGGPSPCGIASFIQTQDVQHFVIADLTIRNFPGKMIKIDGNTGYSGRNIIMHNIELHDCGSQMVKVAAGTGISSRDCIVECSYLHYTDALFAESTYETQGVDVHKGVNWIIRYNLFRNFRQGGSGNSDAILMWDHTDSVLTEGNLIINCNMGARMAIMGSGGNFMWALNNIVVADDPDPRFRYNVSFEIGSSVTNGWIYHNTIWNPEGDGSLGTCFNQVPARNNVYFGGAFSSGCYDADNVRVQAPSAFNSVSDVYDFHPTRDFQVPSIAEAVYDLEGRTRPALATAGAYQFSPDAVEEAITGRETELAVSPNPCNASMTVSLSNCESNAQVKLSNLRGQVIKCAALKPRNTIVWDARDISPGVYILNCLAKGKRFSKKVALVR
ncbi:MAG: hypothetical protein A2268_07375 [Candidatus Raymondbacteria bacterium RifOxyA12_full_50_37]|nr:MAG: hypothetical protein A2268_07375 [Candidatus Raymondbacteria bacterium RifOxyA12_full_50_37]OGJ91202.1 MAG: hypothetical protein A2248_01520 [Candidatus Raymondbacteria bacterium RIFOXYA2_FULL_49_16]OGJ95381.1 MAG: hypothetical protein A2487_18120 [Candidatus Raymondbacteria bacterium RifOxyC12_full_50_8]OGJ97600.1 MAG: hypothetical protein A2453_02285 [Candidatus Raymondbacteria bacterium RIFOXYC2_FULL_50_21]OGP44429.1 MAG: hypothetical protein A2324_21020 [Candidatus Raymondbacteria b